MKEKDAKKLLKKVILEESSSRGIVIDDDYIDNTNIIQSILNKDIDLGKIVISKIDLEYLVNLFVNFNGDIKKYAKASGIENDLVEKRLSGIYSKLIPSIELMCEEKRNSLIRNVEGIKRLLDNPRWDTSIPPIGYTLKQSVISLIFNHNKFIDEKTQQCLLKLSIEYMNYEMNCQDISSVERIQEILKSIKLLSKCKNKILKICNSLI